MESKMEMKHIFYKDDIKEILKKHLLSLGYKTKSFHIDTSHYDLNSITATVEPEKSSMTFTIPIGKVSTEEAQKAIKDMIERYKEKIEIDGDILLPDTYPKKTTRES
jgi:hypothetical protein